MRAPWNMNKSPWLTRVHKMAGISYPLSWWPGCTSHHKLTFEYDDLYDYTWYSIYVPHGPVHIMVGGYYNAGDLPMRFAGILDEKAIGAFGRGLLYTPKDLYRAGSNASYNFPEYCADDVRQEDCHMICYEDGAQVEEGHNYSGWLFDSIKNHMMVGDDAWLTGEAFDDKSVQDAFLDVLCMTPWSPGEQLEAGSPVDPSFWPIHPTMDRLMQYPRPRRNPLAKHPGFGRLHGISTSRPRRRRDRRGRLPRNKRVAGTSAW